MYRYLSLFYSYFCLGWLFCGNLFCHFCTVTIQWSDELIEELRGFVNSGMALFPGDIDNSFVPQPHDHNRDVCPMQ
jgi:hypothetical protein